MKRIVILCIVLLAALPAAAQVDMTRYVALGDSLTAGFASGGLTQYYQERSYAALLAEQTGTAFELPLVSWPGLPPLLTLHALAPRPVIAPVAATPGNPINAELPTPYNNLAVPGATLYDMLFTTGDIMNLLVGNTDNVMHDLILRNGVNPAIEQAIGLSPTFVTVWIGNNDILGAALYGTPVEGVTMTPVATFTEMYGQAIAALAGMTSADIVVFTIPNVTAIPYVTTVDPFLTLPDGSTAPIIGSNGPLPTDAYVTLGASALLQQGYGIPGTGLTLPEDLTVTAAGVSPGFVLRPAEVEVIQQRIAAYNQVIRDTAAAMGAHVFDVNAIFDDIAQHGWEVGGVELGTDFLTGGIFSYDGIHPQDVGHAMLGVYLIDYLNDTFGAAIPQVSLYDVLTAPPAPGTSAVAAKDGAVFSAESQQRLQELFPLLSRPPVVAPLQRLQRPPAAAVQ